MVAIRQKLVASSIVAKVTSGRGNTKKYIVVHETDNRNAGADADAHSRLQANGNSRLASWHWQVDCQEAVQSFLHDYRCWAAGTTNGNNSGIQVEICVNSDGDYKKAVQNAAALVAKIMQDENIPLNRVVQHNYFSGKNCPSTMRRGEVVPWSTFTQMIKSCLDQNVAKPQTLPADYDVLYRAATGTYTELTSAQNVREIMKTRFGWVAHIIEEQVNGNKLYRVKTGTFRGRDAVNAAVDKIKSAGLAKVANAVKE